MEEAFSKLQKEGKADVDNLVKWMKDSKVIDSSKEQEDKVRSFFSDLQDKKNVSIEKFKDVVKKTADQYKTSLDAMAKKLAETGPQLLQSAVAGATTAASTLTGVVKDLVPK